MHKLYAVNLFRLAANQGGTEAQYLLGLMYRNGHGVVQSDEEAVKWYLIAAEKGNADDGEDSEPILDPEFPLFQKP